MARGVASGHRVRGVVGIGDIDAERGEGPGDFRLAAADAAREADDERRVHPGKNICTSVRPKNSATPPAIAR